jgi:uncharacterized protein (DUF1697 family)
MMVFIALLRSVNVGGTGRFPMSELKRLCEVAGFKDVRTYIASGNVLFASSKSDAEVKAALETRVAKYAGRDIPVLVRTADEMAAIVEANPIKDTDPARTVAIFLDKAPPKDTLATVKGLAQEKISLGEREIYVYYGAGQGNTMLRLASSEFGTARNMNTVAKLAALATKT